jgi:hypothetical protein
VVRQDGEAVLRKRRPQDVAQKARTAVVVEGSCVGLRVQVETAVLHYEGICSIVAPCQGRTITEAECQASFATDEAAVVQSRADCLRAKNDLCSTITSCSWGQGDVCAPATCAAYCPSHSY